MDKARKSNWGNPALLCISLLICVSLAEAFCRLALPKPNYYHRGNGELPGLWREHPTRVVALAPDQRPIFRFPTDAHWTAPAHDIAAKELVAFVRTNRLVE